MFKCKICDNEIAIEFFKLKELMFGYNEEFNYAMCSNCNCLQIIEFPENIEKYYKNSYYSINRSPLEKKTKLSRFLSKHRYSEALFGNDLLGKALAVIHKNPELNTLKKAGIKKEMSVLDVGCGSGETLYQLSIAGMKNILGIDPFIDKERIYNTGLKISKKKIEEIQGSWDFIFVNHVLEHIENQKLFLDNVKARLSNAGVCLIRIPTVSSFCWKEYRENWIQLDPPRHLFIHSIESISLLAKQCKLKVKNIFYDSSEFQFIGSEQAKAGIPLFSTNSFYNNKQKSIFNKREIKLFQKQAKLLNKKNLGDQISVILTH